MTNGEPKPHLAEEDGGFPHAPSRCSAQAPTLTLRASDTTAVSSARRGWHEGSGLTHPGGERPSPPNEGRGSALPTAALHRPGGRSGAGSQGSASGERAEPRWGGVRTGQVEEGAERGALARMPSPHSLPPGGLQACPGTLLPGPGQRRPPVVGPSSSNKTRVCMDLGCPPGGRRGGTSACRQGNGGPGGL